MAEQEPVITSNQLINTATVVALDGEIDLIRSPQLRDELMALLNADVQHLVIDLSQVPFMDSSGVATLVEALQVQRRKDYKLVLCGMQTKVRSIFEISRLDMVFTIVDDAAAAAAV